MSSTNASASVLPTLVVSGITDDLRALPAATDTTSEVTQGDALHRHSTSCATQSQPQPQQSQVPPQHTLEAMSIRNPLERQPQTNGGQSGGVNNHNNNGDDDGATQTQQHHHRNLSAILYDWYFGALLSERDTFPMHVRKLVAAMMPFLSLVSICFTGVQFYNNVFSTNASSENSTNAPTLSYLNIWQLVQAVVRQLFFGVGSYLLVRRYRTWSDRYFFFWILAQLVFDLLAEVRGTETPIYFTSLTIAVAAISGEVAGLPFILVLLICNVGVCLINDAYCWLLVPGAKRSCFHRPLLVSMPIVFVFGGAQLLLINCLGSRCHLLLKIADANHAATHRMAIHLKNYDTEGARQVLARCRNRRLEGSPTSTSGGAISTGIIDGEAAAAASSESELRGCDPRLIDAFSEIVHNLERYRPHLPTYVLPQFHGGSKQDGAVTAEGEGVPLEEHRSPAVQLVASGTEDDDDDNDRGDGSLRGNSPDHHDDDASDAAFPTDLTPESGLVSLICPEDDDDSFEHRGENAIGGGEDNQSSALRHPLPPPSERSPNLPRAATSVGRGRVTLALCDLNWTKDTFSLATAAMISTIVNDAAALTFASIHSAVGDRFIVTWNATQATAKPESRACLFAERVRQGVLSRCATHECLSHMAIAITTGIADTTFVGDERFRMFLCSTPRMWRKTKKILELGHCLARLNAASTPPSLDAEKQMSWLSAAKMKLLKHTLAQPTALLPSRPTSTPPSFYILCDHATDRKATVSTVFSRGVAMVDVAAMLAPGRCAPDRLFARHCIYEVIREQKSRSGGALLSLPTDGPDTDNDSWQRSLLLDDAFQQVQDTRSLGGGASGSQPPQQDASEGEQSKDEKAQKIENCGGGTIDNNNNNKDEREEDERKKEGTLPPRPLPPPQRRDNPLLTVPMETAAAAALKNKISFDRRDLLAAFNIGMTKALRAFVSGKRIQGADIVMTLKLPSLEDDSSAGGESSLSVGATALCTSSSPLRPQEGGPMPSSERDHRRLAIPDARVSLSFLKTQMAKANAAKSAAVPRVKG